MSAMPVQPDPRETNGDHPLAKLNVQKFIKDAACRALGIDPPKDIQQIGRAQKAALATIRPADYERATNPARRWVDPVANSQPRIKFRLTGGDIPRGDEQALMRPPMLLVPQHEARINGDGQTVYVAKSPEQWADEHRREVIRRAYAEQDLSLEDLLPYRIRVAWRFVREWGRILGLLLPDESLAEALKPNDSTLATKIDPWQVPNSPWKAPRNIGHLAYPEVVSTIEKAETLPEDLCFHRWDYKSEKWLSFPGLSILPPPVPPRWWTPDCDISDTYDINHDEALHLYLRAVKDVTTRLYVEQGSQDDLDQGRYGLAGLLEPETLRMAFPTRLQILVWEEMLTEETLDLMLQTSNIATKKELRKRYGLQDREINTLMRLATRLAAGSTSGDVEENRSMMVLRLEEYIRRSRDALDLSSEMKGLKQVSLVQGLGNDEKQDLFAGMMEAVRTVAADRRAMLPGHTKIVENTAELPMIGAESSDNEDL